MKIYEVKVTTTVPQVVILRVPAESDREAKEIVLVQWALNRGWKLWQHWQPQGERTLDDFEIISDTGVEN